MTQVHLVILSVTLLMGSTLASAAETCPTPQPTCTNAVKCIKRAPACADGISYVRVMKGIDCVSNDGKLVSYETEEVMELNYSHYVEEKRDLLCGKERDRILVTWDMCAP